MKMELVKVDGQYTATDRPQVGTTNFMSWERLDRELLGPSFPKEYIAGLTVTESGLEIRLERLPDADWKK